MMQPQKWWAGVIPLALIWGAANYHKMEPVEQGIAARAGKAVAAEPGLIGGKVKVSGRDVTVTGRESVAAPQLRRKLQALDGARLVNIRFEPLALQDPYRFAAIREGKSIRLEGHVPSPQVRAKIMAAARAAAGADGKVDDRLAFGAGAPDGMEKLAVHGLKQLEGLSAGTFTLAGNSYGLEGKARDSKTYESILAARAALPTGAKAGDFRVTPPVADPFVFAARRDGDTLSLSGNVPDPEMKKRLLAKAERAFGTDGVKDGLTYAAGAPENFEAIALHGIGLAGKLSGGSFALNGNVYALSGRAANSAGYAAARAAVAQLPKGARAGAISVSPPQVPDYTFSLVREGDKAILQGFVPNQKVRDAVLAQARKTFGADKVVDRLRFADGAPAGFEAAAVRGIALAGSLEDGAFSLANESYSVSGRAKNQKTYEAALAAAGGFPKGLSGSVDKVLPPMVAPYTFSIARENGKVVLNGHAPSASARDAILAQARKTFGPDKVVDRLQIGDGAPAGFAALASRGMEAAAALDGGTFALAGRNITISGDAASQKAYAAARAALGAIDGPFSRNAAAVRPPVVEPFGFNVTMRDGKVVLDGAVPDAATRDALLARAARLYPGANIENNLQIGRPGDGKRIPAGYGETAGIALEKAGLLKSGRVSVDASGLSIAGNTKDAKSAEALRALAGSAVAGGAKIANVDVNAPLPSRIGVPLPPSAKLHVPPPPAPPKPVKVEVPMPPVAGLNVSDVKPAPAPPADPSRPDGSTPSGPAAAPAGVTPSASDKPEKSGEPALAARSPQAAQKAAPETAGPAPKQIEPAPSDVPDKAAKPGPQRTGGQAAAGTGAGKQGTDVCMANDEGFINRARVQFLSGSHRLGREANAALAPVIESLKQCPSARVYIEGHADERGGRRYNIRLSSRRTFAVKRRLISNGIARDRIVTTGFGPDRPEADNRDFFGRAKNRRAIIIVK